MLLNLTKGGKMKTNLNIVINEQHKLMPEQEKLIDEMFGKILFRYITVKVPANGWNRQEQESALMDMKGAVLFISPIPYMMVLAAEIAIKNNNMDIYIDCRAEIESRITAVMVMCNDTRAKKELPNGKVISVVAETGWYIA
jgi:hypothetical protein